MITPKEKAQELVEKFMQVDSRGNQGLMFSGDAKECAIICVDEISEHCPIRNREYWIDVRKEIENS